MPFEVPLCEDGRRLIDDYHISYLSVGRDILRFGAGRSGRTGSTEKVDLGEGRSLLTFSHEPAQDVDPVVVTRVNWSTEGLDCSANQASTDAGGGIYGDLRIRMLRLWRAV